MKLDPAPFDCRGGAPARPTLRDIQHALALERGLESWAALKKQVTAEASPTGDSAAPLTALLGAADRGDAAEVTALGDANPDIVSLRGVLAGHTGLRTALNLGIRHEPVVRALLDRGADPNVRDEGDNAMPLHFAAENQDLRVIQLLIERGADPIGAGDGHELEVIGWACCCGYREANKDVVDYLLAHGARHHIFSAVAMGEIDIIRTLVADSPTALKGEWTARTNDGRRCTWPSSSSRHSQRPRFSSSAPARKNSTRLD